MQSSIDLEDCILFFLRNQQDFFQLFVMIEGLRRSMTGAPLCAIS
jgi:hypothetical protein